MGQKDNMLQELRILELSITSKTREIEKKIDDLDATRKRREDDRKSIVLKEMKKLLVILNDVDKKVSQDLKMEAFDNIRSMSRLRQEILSLQGKLKFEDLDSEEVVVDQLNVLKNKASILEESFSVENLSLSVSCSQDLMTFLGNSIKNVVYLKTPELDPRHYSLDCSSISSPMASSDSHIEIKVHCSLPQQFNQKVLAKLVLCLYYPDANHVHNRRVLEEGSMNKLIKNKKAFLATPTTVVINIKKPKNLVATIEVKMLDTDVLSSPRVFRFLSTSEQSSMVHDLTSLDITGIGKLCQADLDQSDCEVWDTTDLSTQNVEVNEDNSSGHLVSEVSCWRPLSERPEDDLDEEYNDNPHLFLNASKAPESGAGWPSVDPSWDGSTSLLPQPCLDKSLRAYSSTDNNQTIWESDSCDSPGSNYDIAVNSLVLDEVFKSQPVSSSTFRGTKYCLVSPHSIAFLPSINYFIVTEPELNRVGLYQGDSFKFECWLQYPVLLGRDRQYFTFPTSILSLSNSCIALMERNKFHVFDKHVRPIQAVSGTFLGLTEGPNLQILTLSKNKEGLNVIKRFVNTTFRYKYAGMILIRVVSEFDNWQKLSSLAYLCYNQGKVFITDKGLHKIFIVDLTSGMQTTKGYLGEGQGQFKRPTGIVFDDVGNLLVGDSGNNRLGVYTDEGKFIKVVGLKVWHSLSPRGLVRVDDLMYVALKGDKEGAIARYKLEESQ